MKIVAIKRYVDEMLGFPVEFDEVFTVEMLGESVPLIDYEALENKVLGMLPDKPGRLTGSEIKFVRKHFDMTLTKFGERFGVRHSAVKKWEDESATMNWGAEVLLRLMIFHDVGTASIDRLFERLDAPRPISKDRIKVSNADVNATVTRMLDPEQDIEMIKFIESSFKAEWAPESSASSRISDKECEMTREVDTKGYKKYTRKKVENESNLSHAA